LAYNEKNVSQIQVLDEKVFSDLKPAEFLFWVDIFYEVGIQ